MRSMVCRGLMIAPFAGFARAPGALGDSDGATADTEPVVVAVDVEKNEVRRVPVTLKARSTR